jgi:high-affinity Fe2+/Pb2+ permease
MVASPHDDATIAEIAEALVGFGDARAVRSWRVRLLGGIKHGRK